MRTEYLSKNARSLVTLDANHDVWKRDGLAPSIQAASYKGMIVRLRPPPGTPESWTDAVIDMLRPHAVAVRLVPPVVAPPVVVPNASTGEPLRLRPRDVVEAMVNDAVGVDVDALRALVGGVLDKEGL